MAAPAESELNTNQDMPWVEKYRPAKFDQIVLSDNNRRIMKNILSQNVFPNLLLYGPPGTGKTTTIINLIREYQLLNNEAHKELVIHLNASDERGIDIIKTQIMNFVNSANLFNKGTKFVVLDEVDYMTKTAQIALKYLIEQNSNNIKFCLMCNYINKMTPALQDEFIKLRFNRLPRDRITGFLQSIAEQERLSLAPSLYDDLINLYESDVRSMINNIQNNHNETFSFVINNTFIQNLLEQLKTKTPRKAVSVFQTYMAKYNVEKYKLVLTIFNYLVKDYLHRAEDVAPLLDFAELILHTNDYTFDHFDDYFITNLVRFI